MVKLHGKTPHGIARRIWKDNIKMDELTRLSTGASDGLL